MVRTSMFDFRRTADAPSSSCCFRALIASLQPISPSASAIRNPMPRDAPVTSATFPLRSNSLLACMVVSPPGRVYFADGRSAACPARRPTSALPIGGDALGCEIAEALAHVQLELFTYRSAILRPRSSSNSPGVPRPRSRDLVIFWSATGDLRVPPKITCVD